MSRPARTQEVGGLFRVQPDEIERVSLMFVLSVLAVGGIVITGQLVGRSLFLSSLPPSAIPLRFILPPLAMIGAAALYTRAADRIAHGKLFQLTLALAAAGVVVVRLLMLTPLAGTLGFLLGLFIFFDVVAGLAMILFWTLAGDLFNPREAKRLFGVISGGSAISNIAFGAFLSRFATAVPPEDLMLVVVASVLACQWVVARLTRRYPVAHGAEAAAPAQSPRAGASGRNGMSDLRELLASPLMLTLGAIVVVVALAGNIADYQLDLALKASYGADGQGMVQFLALFRLVAGVVAVLLQFVVAGYVMNRFGVLPALLLLPLAVGAGSVAVLASGGALWAVAIPRAADVSLKYTVNDSAFNLLYLPLSARLRARAKAVVDGVVKPPLVAALGLVFLAAGRVRGISLLYWTPILLALVAVWVFLLFRASRRYVEALSRSLTMRRLDLGQGTVDLADETSARVIAEALSSPDPLRVIHTLDLLRGASESDWSDLVVPLLEHPDTDVRVEAIGYLGYRKAARDTDRLRNGMTDPDERVRGATIGAYCAIRGPKSLAEVAPCLADESLAIRGAAIVALIRFGGLGGFLHAGRPLNDLLVSPEAAERRRGAEVLGELGVASFYGPLVDLMNDPDREVRLAALRACRQVAAPELIPALRETLGDPITRRTAIDAVVACARDTPAKLGGLAADASLPWEARADLCRALGGLGAAAAPVLARLFNEADARVRPAVYAALLQLRETAHAPALAAAALTERLHDELRAALARRVCLHDIESGGGAHPLLVETLAVALRRDEDGVLSVLALMYPRLPIAPLREAMANPDRRLRANAVELIDNVVQVAKTLVIPYVGGTEAERLEAARRLGIESTSRPTRLEQLAVEQDPWLRACALAASGGSEQEAESMSLAPLEKVLFLKQVPLFREIPPEQVAFLLPIVEEVSFREGDVILRQGETADSLYLIVEGRVQVEIDGRALEKTLGSRDVFGELGILTGDPRAATCTATSEVIVLRIHRDPFWQLMHERPEVPIGVIKILLGYIRKR